MCLKVKVEHLIPIKGKKELSRFGSSFENHPNNKRIRYR